jgi:hypothetical protein
VKEAEMMIKQRVNEKISYELTGMREEKVGEQN